MEVAIFKIQGMHCASCAMNIDGALEDLEGVAEARTSYAKAETKVTYDPLKVEEGQLEEVIAAAGYTARV